MSANSDQKNQHIDVDESNRLLDRPDASGSQLSGGISRVAVPPPGGDSQASGRVSELYGKDDDYVESHTSGPTAANQNKFFVILARFNPLPHGGMASSGFNLASATLGAGTLAIPYAMANAGGLLGSILLGIACAATVYAIRMLVYLSEKTGCKTYEDLSLKLVGLRFKQLTAFIIILFCWGVTLVYVVAVGSILEKLQKFPSMPQGTWGRRGMICIFWTLFMLPLSMLKEINSLRYASLLGMLSTIVLVAAICAHAASNGGSFNNIDAIAPWTLSMVEAVPTFTFAFCCQTNCFEIYTEMRSATVNKMTLSSGVSMFVCTCIYVIGGLGGMAEYGTEVKDNILDMYDPTHTVYLMIAFVCIAITVTMAFPICILPTRDAILQVLGYEDAYHCPNRVRLPLCAGLAFASLVLGLFVPNMKILFGVLGGVCGSAIAYIWPAVFAYRSGFWTIQEVGFINWLCMHLLFWGGVIMGVLGTAVSIYQTASPSSSSNPAASPNTTAPSTLAPLASVAPHLFY